MGEEQFVDYPSDSDVNDSVYKQLVNLSDYHGNVGVLQERYNAYPRVTLTSGSCMFILGFQWMVQQLLMESHLENNEDIATAQCGPSKFSRNSSQHFAAHGNVQFTTTRFLHKSKYQKKTTSEKHPIFE